MKQTTITVNVFVNLPMEKVWEFWTAPQHIIKWNQPSEDWRTSKVENNLKPGGSFLFVMEAKDGSGGFDFKGAYDEVIYHEKISYTLDDGRRTTNYFIETDRGIQLTEIFEPQKAEAEEFQRKFCEGVLHNFKIYAENNAR